MKNASLDLKQLPEQLKQLSQPVVKHHVIIAVMILLVFLIVVIFRVNQIISTTTDSAYADEQRAKSVRTVFDEKTIEKINQLKSRQENTQLQLPSSRYNPFTE
ncbi:hypothetical protein CYG49_05000 [Candidatus Saccharibacteria bacterium]|nr:MAG: hypothetical protein CYG49_05000 [Candidatus Saccharibacteria bacterium]